MRVNSVSNNSMSSYAQPSFKAQMSKEDIRYALNKMKTIELYNPYEKLPQLYTALEYAKTCPGDKLSFYFHQESDNGVSLYLDDKRIDRSSFRADAWALIIKSYVGIRNPNITTHARMPESEFNKKWFNDNLHVTEDDILNLAYDA